MNGIVTFLLLCLCATVALAQSEQPNRTLDRNYYPNALELAVLRLTASNRIETSQPIEYQAGKSVVLATGFQTRPGATFLASTAAAKMNQEETAARLAVTPYPNPFVERTTIAYQLAEADYTTLYISDMDGKEVGRLVDNQLQQAGRHEVMWQAAQLPSGVYICTLKTGHRQVSSRIIRR